MTPTPPAARAPRRLLPYPLLALCTLAALAGPARAQAINEPPVLPVHLAAQPSSDGVEAFGFTDGVPIDISLIRNGVVIATIPGATSTGGVLNVNAVGGVCWVGVTPDIRPGDIVRYAQQGGPTDQVHVMPITVNRPIQIPGGVEIHGTAADLNGAPIPIANIEQRLKSPATFAFNGKRTLRAGGAATDGVFTYDTVNNPTGTNFTVQYTGLSASDINTALNAEPLLFWLGTIPANANEQTIYSASPTIAIPGPLPGTCTAPLEPLDVTPPTTPTGLASTVTGPSSRNFTWTASNDNVGVAGYELRRDGAVIASTGPLVTSAADANVPAGSHAYTVVAFDDASPLGAGATPSAQIAAAFGQPWGNRSNASAAVTVLQADVVNPTAPTTVTVATGNGKALPSWGGATDNVGVVSYGVYRNNLLIATVPAPTTTYKDSGLVTGTYNYSVDAVDAAGLRSAKTPPVAASVVFIPDTTPPTVPGGISAAVTPDIHGRTAVINWNAATDSMGVTGYTVYRNNVQRAVLGPNTLTFTDGSLPTGTYTYKIDAFDAANNHSAKSVAGTAVIANDPPLAPHVLTAQSSRDGIAATGYPAANGPYTLTLIRGGQTFTSAPVNADGTGLLQLNLGAGGCWSGTTPDLRAGDVVRITDANGIAEQTTIASLTTQFGIPNGSTVVVHGTAQDAAGNPLPLSLIEHHLVAAGSVFDKNSTAQLRATATGAEGTIAYDAPGSTHWTATYPNLSAADVERAVGSATVLAARSQVLWLGRTPAEQSLVETGFLVSGGPASGCATPAESPAAVATFFPTSSTYPDVSAIPPATSLAKTIEVQNTGNTTMNVYAVYIAGLHAQDFTITSATPPATLAPGAFFTVDVTFSPKALGHRVARLCVSADAAGTTALTVPIDGNGVTDVTPPTIPPGVAATNPDPHGHEAFLTWSPATDSVGVTGYTVYRDGSAIGTTPPGTLAYHDSGLAAGVHLYRVDAFDLQNNHSAQSSAARITVAFEPPVAGHVLEAHPARDQVAGTGYAVANGPFTVEVFRGNKHFISDPANADGNGALLVNGAAGACWNGTTPNLRAGDIVRVTDANGNADQTTILKLVAGPAAAIDSATVVVHGVAADGAGNPLPIAQLDHQLVLAAGAFDKSGTPILHADAIAYDSTGSKHWTATYSNLTAGDVVRATGNHDGATVVVPAAESQGIWLGGTERTVFESGPAVLGGPATPACGAAEPGAQAAFLPVAVQFGRQGVGTPGEAQPVIFQNSGDVAMSVDDVRITGLHASDFTIVSDLPASIAPHSAITVSVKFNPTQIGARQAAVTLSCDAANASTVTAPLAGTGWSGLVIKAPGGPQVGIVPGSQISPAGGTRTLPVSLSWGPSLSPEVDHYDVQQSVNGGPWVDAPVQPGSLTGVTLALPLAPAGAPAAWCFRVRAAGAGETSDWVSGNAFGLEPVDDTNLGRCNLGPNWSTDVQADAWAGSEHKTLGAASIELKPGPAFTDLGSIAFLTTLGPDRGKVSVKVDNRDSVVVDLYSDQVKIGAIGYVATNLVPGKPHNFVVHALGRRSVLSTGYRVDADGFIVMNGAVRGAAVAVDHRGGGSLMATEAPVPATLAFCRIAPNPTAGRTVLTFGLPREGAVQLDLLDVQGRRIARLADGVLPAGEQSVVWDGRVAGASAARSGVYFAVLRYEGQSIVRRLVLVP